MSATEHDALTDLVAAVALGAATPDEVARVEAHAATCAVCREELAGFRMATSAIGLTAPQHDPPPALRDALLAEVRRDAALRRPAPAEVPPPARRSLRERLRLRPWPAVAAVATAVALVLVGWNVALQTRDDGGAAVRSVAIRGTAEAPGIGGRALIIPDEGTAVVRLENLPATEPGQQWELWAIGADGTPVSRGFMTRTADGAAVVATTGLSGVTALAVTPELPSNVSGPTSPPRAVVPIAEQG